MVLKKFRWRNWVLWQLMLILFKDDTIMNVVLNYIFLLGYFYLHKWLTPLMKPGFRYLVSLRYSVLSFWPQPEMEFKKFEPRFKSPKTRFKLSAGLTILSGTNHI